MGEQASILEASGSIEFHLFHRPKKRGPNKSWIFVVFLFHSARNHPPTPPYEPRLAH
jgi:hypothetical protein